jgi:hypothetical protein
MLEYYFFDLIVWNTIIYTPLQMIDYKYSAFGKSILYSLVSIPLCW